MFSRFSQTDAPGIEQHDGMYEVSIGFYPTNDRDLVSFSFSGEPVILDAVFGQPTSLRIGLILLSLSSTLGLLATILRQTPESNST